MADTKEILCLDGISVDPDSADLITLFKDRHPMTLAFELPGGDQSSSSGAYHSLVHQIFFTNSFGQTMPPLVPARAAVVLTTERCRRSLEPFPLQRITVRRLAALSLAPTRAKNRLCRTVFNISRRSSSLPRQSFHLNLCIITQLASLAAAKVSIPELYLKGACNTCRKTFVSVDVRSIAFMIDVRGSTWCMQDRYVAADARQRAYRLLQYVLIVL